MEIQLPSEASMMQLGRSLAGHTRDIKTITFEGDLGAGKTTLVRSLLRGLGYQGKVKSPTYALVESYLFSGRAVHHFDLYRISDPEELEYIGFSDYCDHQSLVLIEWPEKAAGELPVADWQIKILYADEGRKLSIQTETLAGSEALKHYSLEEFSQSS